MGTADMTPGMSFRQLIEAIRVAMNVRCETCNYYMPQTLTCGMDEQQHHRNHWCMDWDKDGDV